MRTKDILIVSLSNTFKAIESEEYEKILTDLEKKFKGLYNVLVLKGENETSKTTFEIIKYEN